METDSLNPIVLTLDEIIALQSLKNNNEENETNSYQNRNREGVLEENDVDRRLRDTPGFGSKPIHRRLGYNNHNIINRTICRNMKYKMAQKSIYKARHRFFTNLLKPQRKPVNPLITFSNPNALDTFVEPLTRNSVNKFNRMNNSSFYKHNGSTRSVVSSNFNHHRHSVEKCLNPIVQEEISKLKPTSNPINMAVLDSFKPAPEKTNISTNDRFSRYI